MSEKIKLQNYENEMVKFHYISPVKYFLFILAFLSVFFSFGQKSVDLANLYWRFSPAKDLDSSALQRDLKTIAADLKYPWVMNGSNIFIFGLQHQRNTISNISDSSSLIELKFQSSVFQLGWEHKWSTKSKFLAMAISRLNGDGFSFNSGTFQIGGILLGTTARSDKFKWKYGSYVSSEFFGPLIVPLVGFDWNPNSKWSVKLLAPVRMSATYSAGESINVGLMYEGLNSSFKTNLESNSSYLDKADNNVWLFSEVELKKNIWLHLKAGHSVFRTYDMFQNSDQTKYKLSPTSFTDKRTTKAQVLSDGLSFELRFIYRLPL